LNLGTPAARGLAIAALLFNAFTWGVSWWPFRQLQALGVHPLWQTTLVFAAAVGVLVAVWPRAVVEVARTPSLWVLVLAAGTTNACFNWGVTIGDVVRVVLLFYLMPLWSALLAWLLLGERAGLAAGMRIALALSGAAVVLWPAQGAPELTLGLPEWLGLAGGFSFALNNVMLRREAGRSEHARALAMFLGGLVVAGALALWQGRSGAVPPPPEPAWGWVLGTAALAVWFIGSNLALQYGAARLDAHTTAVVMISEVLFASVSALALGAGRLTPQVAAGGALIVGAALLAAWRPRART
jgi:drug/metabolite transporter (DMT)-like permease